MADEVLGRKLAAFLPRTLWGLLEGDTQGSRIQGCALFADVAGFTPLTESLAKIGKEGAEELTRILNDFFSAMVGIAREEGGDVLRFGGDAMTLFFPEGTGAGLRAALRMQEAAGCFGAIQTRGGVFSLGMKIGISSGPLLVGTVGDSEVGRDYFAAGRCLDLAADAEHHATRGQIALCPECTKKLPAGAPGVAILPDGFGLIADPALAGGLIRGRRNRHGFPPVPEVAVLEAFLPPFVVAKARASHGVMQAEHRRTTVLFLSFSGLDYEGDPGVVEKLRAVYRQIALAAAQHGGWVNKLDMGDKGSKAIVLFGAPQALEHQEERACRAALALLADTHLRSVLTDLRAGITASPLFAAYVGGDDRREYTVMGDGINMAARLMANAHAWKALASREVMEQAGRSLAFRELDPIFVKGKSEKVAIFGPEGEREDVGEEQGRFVGRGALLDETLPGLLDPKTPAALLLTGGAGVGKSALLHRMGRALSEAGIRRITVPLVAHSVHSYLAAWRPVLFASLGVSRAAPAHIREGALHFAVADADRDYLPLFGPLIGLDLPETEASGALGAKERKDVLFAMLVRLFLGHAEDQSYGILLDQMEHADPASLELLQALVSETGDRPLKVVVASRGQAADGPGEGAGAFKVFTVPPFSEAETRDYVVHAGGMTPPTDTFLEFLQRKTGGNPKFLEQILVAMRKAGLVAPGPSGLLEVDEDRLASTAFPDTLEGLLLARVDGLPEEERSLLKAASVLGPSFSLNLLQTLTEHPQDAIVQAVRSLEGKGVVRMDTWGARPYATFADPLLRDALYESLNFMVKRAFHARVAELLEQQGADEPRLWPPLARHFEAAGDDAKARHYLWNAAEDARAKYDNTSAFDFLGRYVGICEKSGADPADDVQFRRGLLYLAEASKELGRLDETDAYCKRILDASILVNPESVAALIKVADNKRRRGDPQGALEIYEKAALMARLIDDKIQQMNIVLDSGVPLAMMGRFDEAMARFQKAEKLARKFKVYSSLVYALMNQGLCYYHGSSDCEQALMVIRKARRVAAGQRLRPMLMNVSVNLGQVFSDMGRYKEALAVVEEGIMISKQFGYRQFYLSMLGNRVLYETMLGMWDKARHSVDLLLTASRHHGMQTITANGVHALAILESVEGDIGAAFAGQFFAAEVHLKMGAWNDAMGCINEILFEAEQWGAPRILDERLEDLYRVLELKKISSDAAAGVAFRAHRAYHDVSKGELSISTGLGTIEETINAAKAQSSPWLLAEVGELYLRLSRKCKLNRKVCKLASELAEKLSDTYCPQKVVPFLLTLAELVEQGCPEIQMQFVLKSLKRSEPVMDRGLTGIRYHALLSRVAQRAGRKKVAWERRQRAVQIAQTVLALQKSQIYRKAFLALPEVQDLLGSSG